MNARTEFVENQLGLYFSVGAAEAFPENLGFKRHQAAFEALEASFLAQADELFSERDVTVSEDFRFEPIELCEFEGRLPNSTDRSSTVSGSIAPGPSRKLKRSSCARSCWPPIARHTVRLRAS